MKKLGLLLLLLVALFTFTGCESYMDEVDIEEYIKTPNLE